ncbi:Molybdenum cofactor synthesis protein 3 [Homalodisca vitripennis]|nr:Molybdenum cofactor synthesis protein 3 [Homalodisca vitripennis]
MNTNLPRELRVNIEKTMGEEQLEPHQQPQARQLQVDLPQVPSDKMEKRKTCSTCPWAKQRKTAYMCIDCKKPVCLECSRKKICEAVARMDGEQSVFEETSVSLHGGESEEHTKPPEEEEEHNLEHSSIPAQTLSSGHNGFLDKLNANLEVQQYQIQLSSSNALELLKQYDVVVDASDNVATRYLVNDACVLTGRPLVSGSALQLEGQLTVYNHADGPCYRCLYPQPPAPQTVTNCSDAGVLGAVTGVIGTLQALEVVKITLGMSDVLSSKLLLFDGENTSFRTIKLRKKSENCLICGTNPSITELVDYEEFCGAAANDKKALSSSHLCSFLFISTGPPAFKWSGILFSIFTPAYNGFLSYMAVL